MSNDSGKDIQKKHILLTGATGYVGGRLYRRLVDQGHRVRCLVRRDLGEDRHANSELVIGDVLDADTLPAAFADIDIAYYMIHSMGAKGSFRETDRLAAENFAEAAKAAGVKKIIYLGGLGQDYENLSPHLKSRQEVGKILAASGTPVIEFRASIVIGSGSLSFEMVRALVERLPLMITPKWVNKKAQPIAIEDLLSYLLEALDDRFSESQIYEIGGQDQVSYAELMRYYGKCRNIKVRMVSVPILTPWLSSLWLGLITPLYARIGRKLIESIVHATVVHDNRALEDFTVKVMSVEEAIRRALRNEEQAFAETRWSDALSSSGEAQLMPDKNTGLRVSDSRSKTIPVSIEDAFTPIRRIGGKNGWYAWNSLWRLRGFLDLLVGGIGIRRGRRDPEYLQVGDTLDWWRVEAYEENRFLRLYAEMKLPGRAWLEFEVKEKDGGTEIRQTAIFDPKGFWGRMYWYSLLPLHELIFGGMLRSIARQAKKLNQKKDKSS